MTSTYKSVNFFNQRRAGAEGDGGIQCSSGVPPPTVTDPTKELCYEAEISLSLPNQGHVLETITDGCI